jgi:hypothetical protein
MSTITKSDLERIIKGTLKDVITKNLKQKEMMKQINI